ncbi:MAG TPA: hypothetical protein PKJ42_07570 [Candidatus Goldiibacteriota bacterium]|nr:hypothetical protein [Candidatus Goldiibacteriota bacterium]
MNDQKKCEEILLAIAEELPPVVFRNWNRWRDVLPMSPRSVANDDCLGKGPAERVYVGRNAGYTKKSFIDYLRKRTHFTEKHNN